VQVVLLGTAAGGGFPQWNCWCPSCRIARTEPHRAHPRTQSSIAASSDGVHWFVANASPDIREQIERLRRLAPPPSSAPPADMPGSRHSPIDGVILTDAELDHSLGLLLLREARALTLYATDDVARILEHDSRFIPVTRAFSIVTTVSLPLDRAVSLRESAGRESALTVEAFAVPGHGPRFASGSAAPGLTVGLHIRDNANGRTLAYVPGCARIDDALMRRLSQADAVLFDGTFWSEDEMSRLGISTTTGRAMGHIPIGGDDGSLAVMARLPASVRVYVHINNTNPVLIEDSPEREAVRRAGVIIGDDGLAFRI
jgi:pyrroloquinoline quinone biosynthesis protein B